MRRDTRSILNYFLKVIKDGKKDFGKIYTCIKPLAEDEARGLNVTQSPSIKPESDSMKGSFVLAC